jgi:hypothetical protein
MRAALYDLRSARSRVKDAAGRTDTSEVSLRLIQAAACRRRCAESRHRPLSLTARSPLRYQPELAASEPRVDARPDEPAGSRLERKRI